MVLTSDNTAFAAVDAAFQVLRRRLTAQQGLTFGSILPSVLRAILVKNQDVSHPSVAFCERLDLIAEVSAIRPHRNLTPDNAIQATAWELHRYTNAQGFEQVLGMLPPEARDFWHVDAHDPSELDQRIV